MNLSLSDIPQLRLRCQHLSSAPFQEPIEVMRWLTAVQSQDYYGAKWALALRLQNGVDANLDALFNAGAILRTHVLRPTWHFVAPEDIRWLLQLTAPRVHAMNAGMYRQLELDSATRQHALSVMARALASGNHLTRARAIVTAEVSARLGNLGNALTYLLVLDGQVIGTARRTLQKETVTIELASFQPLTPDGQQAIMAAVQQFSLFLEREAVIVWR